MMDKLLIYPGKTDQGIFTHIIDAERNFLEKTASVYHPTIAAYIHNAKPMKDAVQVLITALGAGEYWGNNVNGDFFPESALAYDGPDYGHKTFETTAKVYKHHINKDPTANFGDVILAVYNPIYHRVELIVRLPYKKSADIIHRIENGDYPEWSMGARVPFDVCNVCGNKAPTRAHYCEHAKYYLNKIDPVSGKLVYVVNTRPRFHDISQVLIGADRTAKTLRKVASSGTKIYLPGSALLAEKMAGKKTAAETKSAVIKKEVPADPPASWDTMRDLAHQIEEVKASERPLPVDLLNRLGRFPLRESMSTLTFLGILPKPQEFQRIVLVNRGMRSLADDLDRRNIAFDPCSCEEPPESAHRALDLGAHNFNSDAMRFLRPHMEERSYWSPFLGRRLVILIKRAEEETLPEFVKVGQDNEEEAKRSLGEQAARALVTAAVLYAALGKGAPKTAVSGMDKAITSHPGLAAGLALGAGAIFHQMAGPRRKGQYVPGNEEKSPDTNDIFSRMEKAREKPLYKLAKVGGFGAATKRLVLGVPLAYMASGVLQKHRQLNPHEREGRIRRFIRRNPDILSGAVMADALLSARGKGSAQLFSSARKFGNRYWGKSMSAMGSMKSSGLAKAASVSEFVSSSMIWPLATGTKNLPMRAMGGFLDQAALELGSKLLDRKAKKKSQPSAGLGKSPSFTQAASKP